jgi:excinuclease UvrABC helicase subunit UvrB
MPDFRLDAPFKPTGDQPQAIDKLVEGLSKGKKQQVLLGVTGSGKSYTMASVIEKHQRPTLLGDARVLPGQRGRVLRFVLRLLPARGVPAAL